MFYLASPRHTPVHGDRLLLLPVSKMAAQTNEDMEISQHLFYFRYRHFTTCLHITWCQGISMDMQWYQACRQCCWFIKGHFNFFLWDRLLNGKEEVTLTIIERKVTILAVLETGYYIIGHIQILLYLHYFPFFLHRWIAAFPLLLLRVNLQMKIQKF